jgi:hypothetical protein
MLQTRSPHPRLTSANQTSAGRTALSFIMIMAAAARLSEWGHWCPHATLAETRSTVPVRGRIRSGTHFLGCKCCGTYDRHNEVVQTTMAYFKPEYGEWKFSGSATRSSVDSNYVGNSAKGTLKVTSSSARGWSGPGEPLHCTQKT